MNMAKSRIRLIVAVLMTLLFFSTQLKAQESSKKIDVIILKDGTKLKGEILSENSDTLVLSSRVLNDISILKSNIASIHYNQEKVDEQPIRKARRERKFKSDEFFAAFDIGAVSGPEGSAHLNLTLGKRFGQNLYLGIQGGYEPTIHTSPVLWQQEDLAVLAGYVRFYPFKFHPRLFLSGRVGYGFLGSDDFEQKSGGLNFSPGVGVHFKTRGPINWYLGVNQNFQNVEGRVVNFLPSDFPNEYNYDLMLNRTVFKVGIEF